MLVRIYVEIVSYLHPVWSSSSIRVRLEFKDELRHYKGIEFRLGPSLRLILVLVEYQSSIAIVLVQY